MIAKYLFRSFAALVCGVSCVSAPLAQEYPARPIRMVVPWPPSGTVDILARPLAHRLAELAGQSVIIDNRPGANSIVGSDIVAKAAPDGYTLLIDNITGHAINATLYQKVPFDSTRDFAPVGLLASVTNLLVVPTATGWRTVQDVLTAARAKPGQLNYASFGTGSTAHLAGELFKTAAGIDLVHVPYNGGAPALLDVMAARASMMFATLPSALAHVKGGKLTAIATTSAKRSPATPELPTVAESGLPGFSADARFGLMAPAGTPAPIIARLNKELRAALGDEGVRKKMSENGLTPAPDTPAEYAKAIVDDQKVWGGIVRKLNLKAE